MTLSDDRRRRLAVVLGVVFVLASLPKFLAYGWELDQFRRFGLPGPDEAWVIAAGVIELVGGAMLIAGRAVIPSAVLLAITMVVAFVSSGVLQGDVIPSLTVAPVLLVGCAVLIGSVRARPEVTPARRPGRPRGS